ncbi:hypothetical protein [Paraburkholderia sacchari]|uniref:hypothetical protein n=1 Tax=Paraburkholderia sacchari TaxID=159450 RepID=UPI0005424C89|nr:hypothetical protein [Paraburkholderia sacchari]NLP64949.1 hypothetical protein [Paraburkholderia sacchari]
MTATPCKAFAHVFGSYRYNSLQLATTRYARAPHWGAVQIGVDYFLAKRTDIYLFCDYQR